MTGAFYVIMALTENNLIDTIYALYETDTTGWNATDEEYLAARKYINIAISKWENYDNTEWRDLWSTLTDAADGTKTTTASTYSYSCPTNFKRPSSWVRTLDTNSGVTWWAVVPPNKLASKANSVDKYCYFTGNVADGYSLNFNAKKALTTGHTINYEYYKVATVFDETTDTSEIPDPYYLVYFSLARFLHNDGEDNIEELQEADDRLESMRVVNMSGFFDIPDNVEETINTKSGFEK